MTSPPTPTPTATGPPEKLLVSPAELAAMLGVSRRMIERLAAGGKLPPSMRLGRLRRWFLADVLAHLERLKGDGHVP